MTGSYQMKKIVLLGDAGVGKTVWINKVLTGVWDINYIDTLGVEVHPYELNDVNYEIWDVPGQDKYNIDCDSIMNGADFVFIFYDSTSRLSYRNVKQWRDMVPSGIPVQVVRAKCDLENKNAGKRGTPVSTKTGNPLRPFLTTQFNN